MIRLMAAAAVLSSLLPGAQTPAPSRTAGSVLLLANAPGDATIADLTAALRDPGRGSVPGGRFTLQ